MKKLFLIILMISLITISRTGKANAQTCSTTPPTNTGTVTLSTTTSAGTYRVWSRILAPDTTNNSFYFQLDGGCAVLVGNSSSIPANTWTWVDYQNGTTTSKIDINFTAGNHVITIIGNEPGVGVDKLLLTRNLTCVPNDASGSNCPAEIPTPTAGATDNTPPAISSVTASNITNTSADISWNLNEFASGQIEYGTTSSYGTLSGFQTCCQYDHHLQTLSNLTLGTTYHYRVKSTDAAGNTATSGDFIFATLGGTSPTPTKAPTPIPTITPTNIPTPTPAPNATILRFSAVKLHGIGKGGDNTNPNLVNTDIPLTTTRSVTVDVLDSNNNLVTSATGNVAYSQSLGWFTGDITIPSTISSGSYLIKVRTPKYLKRQVPGIVNITSNTINPVSSAAVLPAGDANNDASVNLTDYNIIADCYSDFLPARNCADPAKKASADITDDGKVTHFDLDLYLRELSVVNGD